MAISTTDLNTLSTIPQTNTLPANTDNTDAATGTGTTTSANGAGQTKLTPEIVKQQFNASILQASLEVSISSQNDPLALVYKSAIENINQILKPQLGDNAIQNAASQDNSPEATAGRILSFIKSAFQMFSLGSSTQSSGGANNTDGTDSADGTNGNAGTDQNAAFDNFMSLIQKGVDQGFSEARGILSGLNVLNGDIASNIDKTYEILKKGIADFIASIKNPTSDDGSTPATGDGSSSSSSSTSVSISISVTSIQTEVTNY
ncbi:hypothetical protein PMI16_02275 [Herbaspirillum sp. CF444]|uniref:DUF5610 domain-containing protein n=1 Tax=Herbaspirillum sp. CF444 TaxID=1144319 RepID=UPI0002727E91|nr:DUF5610 domain-containing protein [Herbaspirillum sp. CF444]EJL88630.1 hypothetical protein PMI16_02275 [Herbaspirillum sp. CF444]